MFKLLDVHLTSPAVSNHLLRIAMPLDRFGDSVLGRESRYVFAKGLGLLRSFQEAGLQCECPKHSV
jgi:hypothetical protein